MRKAVCRPAPCVRVYCQHEPRWGFGKKKIASEICSIPYDNSNPEKNDLSAKSAENTKNNIPVFTILIALILILSVAFPPVGAGILGLFAAVPILSAALTGAAAGLSTAIPIMSGLAITVSSIVSFAVGTYAIDKSTHFIERSKNAFKQLFDKFSNRDTNPIETNEQSNVPPSLNSHR